MKGGRGVWPVERKNQKGGQGGGTAKPAKVRASYCGNPPLTNYPLVRKILAPIKIKSALPPPPPQNPKYPPQNAKFYGHGFFLQKEPGAHKIGAAISGPRIADKTFLRT